MDLFLAHLEASERIGRAEDQRPQSENLIVSNVQSREKKETSSYCRYLPVKINDVTCAALVDSGNLWRNAISKGFFEKLGLKKEDLRPVAGAKSVGTAKTGEGLRVLGETKNFIHLRIGGVNTNFKFRPVVLEGLAMPFNMSGPFLKKHNIDQIHSEDCVRINGQKVRLLSSANRPTGMETAASMAYVNEDFEVPAFSLMNISVRVQKVEDREMPAGEGILMGESSFMEKTDLSPWTGTVVNCDGAGITLAGVMNTLDHPVTIQEGTRYGCFTRTCTPEELERYPWRICIIENPENKKSKKIPEKDDFMVGPNTSKNRDQRLDFLIRTFELKDNNCLKTNIEKAKAALLLLKHWEVFSFDGSFGKTDLLQHRIYTQDGPPIRQRYRPINPSLEPDLRKQIDKWLLHGVIEESNSPWNFALVAAPKKGGAIRWCVDYRALNLISLRDSHPIGNIEDNLNRLSKSKVFSGIDGSGAFHVIEIAGDDKLKTAFATPWGSYHFTRLPFGLANGPSTYARLVQMVLRGIPYSMALPYLDDTVVHSKDNPSHFQALDRVLEAHQKAGLKLQPKKCQLFREEIEYLGHVVSGQGIRPMDDYVKIVQDWPLPNTRGLTRSWLGKVGYYRRFIQNYSAIAKPMTDLTAQDGTNDKEEFQPSPEFKKSFEQLKHHLVKAPILAYPQFDSKEPFILDTDWSADNNAVGAVLSQKQDGIERVIAYGAKKLTKGQSGYSPTKGELAAVITFMRHWKYYLQYRRFLLRVDHASLQWVHTMETPTGMVRRWLDTLANFDFDVQHRPGKKHGNADALSRANHLGPPDSSVDMDEQIGSLEEEPAWTKKFLEQQQDEDPDIKFIRAWVRLGAKPDAYSVGGTSRIGKIYAGLFDSLLIDKDGLLRYRRETKEEAEGVRSRDVIILPQDLWTKAIQKAHLAGAHMMSGPTMERLRKNVYFPGMGRVVEDTLQRCQSCQAKGGKPKAQRHTLISHVEGHPFQKLSIDFVGPLPSSRRAGNTYIFTVKDTFTRWLEAFPIKAATAPIVVQILEREIFSRYGLCEQIHNDRGTQFVGDLMNQVASVLGIRATHTPAYNPKSNPVERAHRDLGTAVMALVGEDQKAWEDVLPAVLFAMRTAKCRSTGLAPYHALFGRDATQELDLIFGAPEPERKKYSSYAEYAAALQARIRAAHRYARDNMSKSVQRQRRAYHKEKKYFLTGQKVWLFTPRLKPGQSKKFATYWTGPWTILKQINELMYEITPETDWRRKTNEIVSIDRLKRFYEEELGEGQKRQPPSEDADLSMAGDEFAENPMEDEDEGGAGAGPPGVGHPPVVIPPHLPGGPPLPAPIIPPAPIVPVPVLVPVPAVHTPAPRADLYGWRDHQATPGTPKGRLENVVRDLYPDGARYHPATPTTPATPAKLAKPAKQKKMSQADKYHEEKFQEELERLERRTEASRLREERNVQREQFREDNLRRSPRTHPHPAPSAEEEGFGTPPTSPEGIEGIEMKKGARLEDVNEKEEDEWD
jgi:hypothetical protein